jgi:hypothetical protein
MKCIPASSAAAILALSACDTMNRPLTSGEFDPLRPPGSEVRSARADDSQTFRAGQFVRCLMDNTAFFFNRPSGDMDADKLLRKGTSMKVISTSDAYTRVELDGGEVGWVPTILLEDPNAPQDSFSTNPGEYQVYPPPGAFDASIPVTDPADLPPGGAIPTVIDPEAPAGLTPIPPVTVPTEGFDAPAAPTLAPLPPNGEEGGEAPLEVPPGPAELPPGSVESDPPVEATPKLEE